MFNAEAKLRQWSEIYPNAYVIGVFACCRQMWDPETMTGYLSKEEKEGKVDIKKTKQMELLEAQKKKIQDMIDSTISNEATILETIKRTNNEQTT